MEQMNTPIDSEKALLVTVRKTPAAKGAFDVGEVK